MVLKIQEIQEDGDSFGQLVLLLKVMKDPQKMLIKLKHRLLMMPPLPLKFNMLLKKITSMLSLQNMLMLHKNPLNIN